MKRTLVIIFICFSFVVNAQKTEDVVYLKNGSIIRGTILEVVPEQYVKIQIIGGSVFVFEQQDILKIVKEPLIKSQKQFETKTKGYFNASSVGFLIGNTYYYYSPVAVSILLTNGIKWPNRVYAGIGSGFEFLRVVAMPWNLEARFDLLDKRISPYLKLTSGYLLPLDGKKTEEWEYNYTGGFSITPTFGFRNYFNNNTAFDLSFGYRYEELFSKRYDTYYQTTIERREVFNRIYFSIGLIFR